MYVPNPDPMYVPNPMFKLWELNIILQVRGVWKTERDGRSQNQTQYKGRMLYLLQKYAVYTESADGLN